MTPQSHKVLREALAAYTLGALDATERAQVEAHLAGCDDCRGEVATFAALPALLSRLSPAEADAGLVRRSPARIAERSVRRIAAARASSRRRLVAWRAAALLGTMAAVVLAVVLVGGPPPGQAVVFRPDPVASDAAGLRGEVLLTERAWGMTVDVELRGLPERRGFALQALTADDHRATAATWAATDRPLLRLTGACYLEPGEVVRLELVTPDGEVLAVFRSQAARA